MGNGISVTIGGNADPLLNEFKRVKNAAGAVSYKLTKGFGGGSGGHGGKTGAISEAIVMARELSRGNFSRLPGSFSLLLQRSGALAKILPFILNPITGIAAGLLAGAAAAYKLNNYLVSSLTGLDHAELKMSYIPKHLQSINRAVEAQKELNLEVSRAVELYHGVAEQSERTVEAVRKQFDHLRKMNELTENDPSKREKNRVSLDKQERAEMLRLQANEELALQKESQRNLKAAQEFIQGTPSAAQDEANVKYRESDLAKGEEDLKKREAEKSKYAKGGIVNNMSVNAFADGGIVDKPTLFNHSAGQGLMGEAGSEAIMPLKRGSDGKLGVASGEMNKPKVMDESIALKKATDMKNDISGSSNGQQPVIINDNKTINNGNGGGGQSMAILGSSTAGPRNSLDLNYFAR